MKKIRHENDRFGRRMDESLKREFDETVRRQAAEAQVEALNKVLRYNLFMPVL
jgi:hypothetical protein